MIVRKIAENLWTLREGEFTYHIACVKVFRGHQLTIALVDGFGDGFFVYKTEIYTTSFFATDPVDISSAVLSAFSHAREKHRPVELMYLFGGTIDKPPPIAPRRVFND